MKSVDDTHFFYTVGGGGVTLFFCISGFLITYLLLTERESMGYINLKDFYIRRILRIWPLYYLILFLTLFIIPHLVYTKGFWLENKTSTPLFLFYFFFCPYIADPYYQKNFLAAILWSVGVEETFYLIWPVLVSRVKSIRFSFFLSLLIPIFIIKGILIYGSFTIDSLKPIAKIMAHMRLECMIIGAAFAYFLKKKSAVIPFITQDWFFILNVIFLVIHWFWGFNYVFDHFHLVISYLLDDLSTSLIYCILLVNVFSRKSVYQILESKIIFELGRISYGFYLYHIIGLLIVFVTFEKMGWPQSGYLTICIPAFLVTVLMSYLSYHYFESPFLKLKQKFTHIVSGQEAKK